MNGFTLNGLCIMCCSRGDIIAPEQEDPTGLDVEVVHPEGITDALHVVCPTCLKEHSEEEIKAVQTMDELRATTLMAGVMHKERTMPTNLLLPNGHPYQKNIPDMGLFKALSASTRAYIGAFPRTDDTDLNRKVYAFYDANLALIGEPTDKDRELGQAAMKATEGPTPQAVDELVKDLLGSVTQGREELSLKDLIAKLERDDDDDFEKKQYMH